MGGISSLIREIQNQFLSVETDSMIFHCKLPVEKHVVKKNGRPIHLNRATKRPFIGKSKDLSSAEKYMVDQFNIAARLQSFGFEGTTEEPVHVIYHFHYGPGNTRGYHLSDLSNLFELVSDSLEDANIIANDKQIKSFDGSRKYLSSSTFLEVFVLKFNQDTDLTKN